MLPAPRNQTPQQTNRIKQPHSNTINNPLGRFYKLMLIMCGWLSVALGFIGIFVPILPTTPFLIVAASCFAKSSDRFHHWLLESPVFGPIILDWQTHRRVRSATKRWAMVTIILSFGISIWLVPLLAVRVGLAIGMCLCLTGIYHAPGDHPFKRR